MRKPLPEGEIPGIESYARDGDRMTFTLRNPDGSASNVVVGILDEQLDLYVQRSDGQKRVAALLP